MLINLIWIALFIWAFLYLCVWHGMFMRPPRKLKDIATDILADIYYKNLLLKCEQEKDIYYKNLSLKCEQDKERRVELLKAMQEDRLAIGHLGEMG